MNPSGCIYIKGQELVDTPRPRQKCSGRSPPVPRTLATTNKIRQHMHPERGAHSTANRPNAQQGQQNQGARGAVPEAQDEQIHRMSTRAPPHPLVPPHTDRAKGAYLTPESQGQGLSATGQPSVGERVGEIKGRKGWGRATWQLCLSTVNSVCY